MRDSVALLLFWNHKFLFETQYGIYTPQPLRAWLAYQEENGELFFWRTRSGVEVDFVIYGDVGFWAIEVKNAARVRLEDTRSLEAFREDYPQAELALLYRGTRREKRGRVHVIPVGEFLRSLVPGRTFPIDGEA